MGDFNLLNILQMRKIIILITLVLSMNCMAQSNPEKELGIWYAYGGSHKIAKKITLKSQAQFRFFDIANDMQQLMLRAGANYKFNNSISAYFGYAFFNTDATYDVIHPISNKLTAYVYNEVFLNFQGNTYSQNWFGVGVKRTLSDKVQLQLGYHNISLNGGANFNRFILGVAINTNHLKNK